MGNRAERVATHCVLEQFRYEIRRFLNFSERAARRTGLEPQQHQALLVIKSVGHDSKATIGFLAERLQVHHNTAVELSDRLEQKRLIRRSRSEKDRRKVCLSLTQRGESLLHKLSESHRAELQSAGHRLLKVLQAVIRRASADGLRTAPLVRSNVAEQARSTGTTTEQERRERS